LLLLLLLLLLQLLPLLLYNIPPAHFEGGFHISHRKS
jgi:hypothetical protein